MKRDTMMALACVIALIGWVIGFMSGNIIANLDKVEYIDSTVYRSGKIPYDVPVLAYYEVDGIITATSAMHIDEGRMLEYSLTGRSVPYYMLEQPIAWIEIPKVLVDLVRN